MKSASLPYLEKFILKMADQQPELSLDMLMAIQENVSAPIQSPPALSPPAPSTHAPSQETTPES